MDLQTARKRWFSHATTGALALGTGISLIFDASYRRFSEEVAEIWWLEGSLGFVLFMTGLAFFGSAVRYMVHMDRIAEYSERKARQRNQHRSRGATRSVKMRDEFSGDEIRLKPIKSGAY